VEQDLLRIVEGANRCAPEHLEIATSDPVGLMKQIKNAGSIFLGHRISRSIRRLWRRTQPHSANRRSIEICSWSVGPLLLASQDMACHRKSGASRRGYRCFCPPGRPRGTRTSRTCARAQTQNKRSRLLKLRTHICSSIFLANISQTTLDREPIQCIFSTRFTWHIA